MSQPLSSLEQTSLNRINNLLGSWVPAFAELGERELANLETQATWVRNVTTVNTLFKSIANKRHPEVFKALVAFKAFVDNVNARLVAARRAAEAAAAKYGDADARVRDCLAAYADLGVLRLPAEAARVHEWVSRTTVQLAYLPRAQALLADLVANAPNGQRFAVNERAYRVDMPARLAAMVAETKVQLAARVEAMEWMLGFVRDTDPAEESHVKNRLRGENVDEKLREIRALVDEVAALAPLDAAFGEGQLAGYGSALTEAAAELARKGEVAVASVRMPEDRGEEALAAVARAKLAEKGHAAPRRLVVNAGPNAKESTSTRIEGEWIVTYRLAWEEFQVTTAEDEDGACYLFYNDFTRYTKGDPSTTLGVWLFSRRFRGPRILVENIGS